MKEHTFTIDATPNGRDSCVLLDGDDISSLLRAFVVRSSVDGATVVELVPAPGRARAILIVRVPEAQIVIREDP